ncbi:MAG: radical SAM protein, partial [Acidobacteria bacterium]|nr:radical SAM protein [Acidobacteriota bacterium]
MPIRTSLARGPRLLPCGQSRDLLCHPPKPPPDFLIEHSRCCCIPLTHAVIPREASLFRHLQTSRHPLPILAGYLAEETINPKSAQKDAFSGPRSLFERSTIEIEKDSEEPAVATLREVLERHVREGDLYEKLDRNRVRCYSCGHCCPIPEGQLGVCRVRFNRGGTLYVPWGYVGGVQCDPIEKKPFFHAYPGALAYSFGMLGCDLHCAYCQNWVTSQALRDPTAVSSPLEATPEELVQQALAMGAKVVVSTYNEPLITSEWAVAVFQEAKAAGLGTGFVSNGNGTPQVLEYLRPWVDLYK